MDDAMKRKNAVNVFGTICSMLDAMNYRYDRDEENLTIHCIIRGDDLPMDMIFIVNERRQVVSLFSPMPFKVPEDKIIDMALATTFINDMLVDGSFDVNLSEGKVRFRMTTSFIESILGEEMFTYMMLCASNTVDDYNDKFFMISKGMLSFEKFMSGELESMNS